VTTDGAVTELSSHPSAQRSKPVRATVSPAQPVAGTVIVDGVELGTLDDKDLTDLRRDKVGFVFQAFNLLPVLNAEENILLPLRIAGRTPDRERIDRLIATSGIGDRLTHRPSELSGGQQQREAVARALASRPAVVFADEPTGNLDSTSSAEVLALLRRSVDEFGQTVVMVTLVPDAAAVAYGVLDMVVGRMVGDRTAQAA
jgi:putative ABC transport system ATP-binding protein